MIGGISASKGARVLNFTERSRASPSGFVHRSLFDGYPDCFPVRQGVSRGSSSPNTPVSVLFDFLFGADDRSLCFSYCIVKTPLMTMQMPLIVRSQELFLKIAFMMLKSFLLVLNFRFPEFTHHD